MIKVTLSYPRTPGASFDTDYYLSKHVPFAVRAFTALGMLRAEVDIVTSQVRADEPDVFAVTTQYWRSEEDARSAFSHPSIADVRADTHHFAAGPPTVRYCAVHDVSIREADR